MKPTGAIWKRSARSRAQIVRRVCEALEREYGSSRLGNPVNPVDDLVYIMLTNRTTPSVAHRLFGEIKRDFSAWKDFAEIDENDLARRLEPAGLAQVRSEQILGALRQIITDSPECDLRGLRSLEAEEAEGYLTNLPGVSEKVAKCVMVFTLGFETLPVDAHVHRIARRLGWTDRKRADQCHAELEALVPAHRRRAFHVTCILHGRKVCRPTSPNCSACSISRHCFAPDQRE